MPRLVLPHPRSALLGWLLPAEMERNPAFREELLRLSRTGLRLLGAMELALALFLLPASGRGFTIQFWAVLAIGGATVTIAQARGLGAHVRSIALTSGGLAAAALMEAALWATPGNPGDDHLLYGDLSLALFAVISAVQLIPLQTCLLGSAIGFLYALTATLAGQWDPSLQVFILFLTCFATGVSGLLYARRKEAFEEHQRMIEFRETLTAAQSRAQLAETAIAVGRLAAALTHEINTPLGALKSAADTMVLLAQKQASAKPEEHDRLRVAQADLRRSINDSAERLSAVVERLKRMIALDRSEKKTVNINDLVSDAGLLVRDLADGRIETTWRLGEVPPVVCSTDQMTTALANLFRNAVSAIDGKGSIEVSTLWAQNSVEILIHDTGRGMQPEEADTIFEPGFKVQGGRVLGGNWSLFTTRQIIHEHGGEIWVETTPGEGTTLHVSLPAVRD
jgi:signal transduction histidine kinase